ncbi:hypothetical protein [Streptomyces sp. PSAA01]|uniref:hypothetical protein n=1 Tax=Streptomyces sp. PSAA01 TaxID=2912762 RepID=UPI001F1DAB53|nr:hypothetical protein [Streptomyces sp. PSAA01]MCG0285224.1 hypothetical protein [Streptomyces sp. PSAA01]
MRHTDGLTITQWDHPTRESLGLLKRDFPGLCDLTVMDDAVTTPHANRGITERGCSAVAVTRAT